ncbi:hypothetical protein B566_EDAN008998 [Ephemera danica]|nr:hypothetical protein B566_EDAN008998 [Ephemera danica]
MITAAAQQPPPPAQQQPHVCCRLLTSLCDHPPHHDFSLSLSLSLSLTLPGAHTHTEHHQVRGFLEGGPPDVPPRNPSMSRLNGRSTTGLMGNPADRDGDFEPSCLVRTPSGNVYIPTDIPKTSPMDYKSNSSCSSPSKGDNQKMNSDRCSLPFGPGGTVPGLPVRNNLRRPNSTHFPQSSRSFQFRKGLASKCSWKCTAIVFIILSVVLTAALTYMSATNLLNWSYQSAKACTVLVGENSDLYALKGSDLNRTSSRGTRPSAGGKYLSKKSATDDAATSLLSATIKSYNLMSTSKLASFYLPPPSQANRIRRSVVHTNNNNQHGNADAPSSTVVDVVSHASLTTLHGQLVRDDQFEAIEEGSGSEASRHEPHGEHALLSSTSESHASAHEHPAAAAPSSEHVSTTDTITDEELAEDLGSGFILASAESVQHDSPVYAYGDDEVEIVHLDRNIPSPDANKLNNEVKEVLSLTRNKPAVSKNETTGLVSGVLKLIKNDTLRNITELGLGSDHDNKTIHIQLDDSETSEELQSGKPHDLLTASRHTSGDIRRSTTDEEVLHVSEDFADQHGLSVLTSSDTTEQHRHVEHSANREHNNNSSRHMKRVFVNVTIATEDDDESSSHSEHSPSHPMYVLSVSVPTDAESKTSPNLSHNASIVLGLSDVNSSLLVNLAQPPQSLPAIQETIKPTTTTTTVVPGIQFWGGECQCSCPCLDDTDSNEEQETTSTQVPMLDKEDVEENRNQTTPERLILEVVREEMNETVTDLSLESIALNDSSIDNSTIDDTNATTVELPSEMTEETTVEDQLSTSSSSTTEEAFSAVSMSEVQCTTPTPPPPMVLILEGAKTFPARTFPPDGTTFFQVSLGQRLSREIPQYSYWNMQFYQSEAAYIKFDYSIPRGASIGVYARRNALPTHTQYDFIEVLSGFKARTTRGSTTSVKKEVTHYMEQGHWFVSLYNDDGDPQEVSFIAAVAEDMTENCPNGCSGKGECLLGHCHCNPGFGGDDCSESVCPVLCSQRGEYINGECQCNPGWKGKECSLRHDECEVPDCNGHGHCANGKCACVRGYKGKFCEEVDCPHPTCSGHGFCVEGGCICKKGWKGPDCSQTDDDALMCLPTCSSHGTFNLETQTCTCEAPWTGDDCSRELCDLDCGPNGHCEGDACACDSGWAGDYCNLKQCDARCSEHGQCKNGTCLCVTGWNGRHCTLEGCPNSCSAHGQCKVNTDGAWECRCYDGWDGIDCSVALEQSCSDSRDNDKDGLVDCEDPECCSNHLCRSSQLCVSAPKPIDILLRKQPPAITASFFERMKFLIEEGSLQNYARQESFNESRTAVVRGRVVTASGMGLMGVRVSTSQHLEGFTLTREDGWFDLLVNGGGAVTLQFGRSPFRPQTQIVNVPWNEVVIINTVVMGMGDDKGPPPIPHSCEAHDYDLMKPVVLATWKHGFQGACPDKSAILAESQVVQDSLQIPGTGLNLVYHSSRAAGYLSTIQLQLTPHTIPPLLKLVHLRITIEGILFEKTFEADPDIKFTYAWNRLNVYRQRVYGVTTAMVKVGYEYAECKDIIWDVQTTKLSGHDMSISEVGGWNLDIHHRYNFHEGILQKGDGSNIYLKHKPRVILTTMGNGHQRALDCTDCEGQASKQRLLAPVALTYAPDGSIFQIIESDLLPEANAMREYEIFSPETQEIYIFNRFGQHTATKNILTGETIYIFTYNVNTSNGKLSTVTDAAGNKVFLLRDYSSQVNSVENTKGQKCRLRMSRMRMLQELSTPDNYNVSFDYHGSTGLLRTKLDSTGRSYIYNYDEFGRLTTAVTPTGKVISLSFDLSTVGATVKVKQDDHKPVSMIIKGPSVLKQIGEAEHHRTTLMADGSVISVTPWQHSISTETTAYSVLSDINPVLGESFPVPAKQKTEIGGDLANRFEWRYFLRREGKGKNKAVVQIGRKLRVNGENLLTLEYDRETGTVAVFMDDRVELLNITYDRLARPIKWGPSRNGVFDGVELEYDRFSRLISWKWGDLSETYGFDRAGRLFEIRYGDNTAVTYAFKDMFSSLPLKVTTPRGSDYFLQYDEAGALQSLTTPRGHIHTFALQTSLGFFKYQYFSPMNRHPYEILYNDDSQILAKVYPHQAGKVVYVYDDTGKLENILAGLSSTQYTYQESTGLIKAVDVNEPGFELKQEFKHHAGIVKEERLKFGGKTGLDNAHFKYQYDGNARISGIDADINGKDLPPLRLKFNQNLGMLEGVSDLRVYRNTFNRSVMQDTSKQFFTITDWDSHGRLKSLLINIKFNDVYRLELEYDKRNRISSQKIMIRNKNTADRFTYNSDGHLLEVIGDGNWKYVYDENGNVIGVIERGEKINMGYDSGDRVVQYGDVEFCSYDGRGFVVRRGEQKYRYSSRSYLEHAFEKEKFQTWYHYDERGRLIAWKDDKGNTTQYFYANPSTPELVTHVHYPKTGKTNRLMYDERQILIAVETADKRYYVASDQNGSPLVVFDTSGVIVKQISRTPFGKVTKDTNPAFHIPVDFNGGLLDPHTGLVYLNRRLYDPVIGQWMIPAWEELANKLTTPTDVFIYRFNNNDPINKAGPVKYMTGKKCHETDSYSCTNELFLTADLPSWLNLYGYDVSNMMGSSYTSRSVYMPKSSVTSSQLSPQFGVISGLQCIAEKISEQFRELGFIPKPLLKLEPKTRNLLPRVASRRGVFGEGVLISRVAGRALVSIVEGVNGVIQDVVTSVFNNSHLLDVRLSAHDQAIFYFVKDNALKLRDDQEELKRLGGLFNVSTHEVEHGSSPELRLHNADAAIYIRYGADPAQERHRVLRHAHKRAVERAWEIEKQLVSLGFPGRIDWSEEEREELLSHGTVDGFEGIEAHSIHRYPQLADDPSNVIFQKEGGGKRKRRKSRRSRSHRHDT